MHFSLLLAEGIALILGIRILNQPLPSSSISGLSTYLPCRIKIVRVKNIASIDVSGLHKNRILRL